MKITGIKFTAAAFDKWRRQQTFESEEMERMVEMLAGWMRQLEKKDSAPLRKFIHEDLAKLIWR